MGSSSVSAEDRPKVLQPFPRFRPLLIESSNLRKLLPQKLRRFNAKPFVLIIATIFVAAIIVLHATAAPPTTEAVRKSLQATLDYLRQKDGFPGATAAVVLKDGTLITAATGKSDLESGTTMRPDDRMLAGSIGKTFFAAIVMNMVHDKRLSLDQKIQTYIGSEPCFIICPMPTRSRSVCS
jgi:CubicO group peptidase (beta-lactamase class C family)